MPSWSRLSRGGTSRESQAFSVLWALQRLVVDDKSRYRTTGFWEISLVRFARLPGLTQNDCVVAFPIPTIEWENSIQRQDVTKMKNFRKSQFNVAAEIDDNDPIYPAGSGAKDHENLPPQPA